jgi:hypothetical protein
MQETAVQLRAQLEAHAHSSDKVQVALMKIGRDGQAMPLTTPHARSSSHRRRERDNDDDDDDGDGDGGERDSGSRGRGRDGRGRDRRDEKRSQRSDRDRKDKRGKSGKAVCEGHCCLVTEEFCLLSAAR